MIANCKHCQREFEPKARDLGRRTAFCSLDCYWASKAIAPGSKFGRWTVLAFHHRDVKGYTFVTCECECGTIKITSQYAVKSGQSLSCGCLVRERRLAAGPGRSWKHGLSNTVIARTFQNAKARCTNPNNTRFRDYGGRGIEFRFNSIEEFYAALGDKPSPKHSIDRIDNNGHYEVGNVRWATTSEQNRNKRAKSLASLKI